MESSREPRLSDPAPIASRGKGPNLILMAIAIPLLAIIAAVVALSIGSMRTDVPEKDAPGELAAIQGGDTQSGTESQSANSDLGDTAAPFSYGDDVNLDALWDKCEEGEMAACDGLFWSAPSDSVYELRRNLRPARSRRW